MVEHTPLVEIRPATDQTTERIGSIGNLWVLDLRSGLNRKRSRKENKTAVTANYHVHTYETRISGSMPKSYISEIKHAQLTN